MRKVRARVVVVGAGITGALLAARLADQGVRDVLLVDAGPEADPPSIRPERASRWVRYLERPWPGDRISGRSRPGATGPVQKRTMYVGGQATHWTAQVPRFTPEDFRLRSQYGVGEDWPISYDDLEPFYGEAERRIGVSGEPDGGPRSGPFPMPPVPASRDLERIRAWAGAGGLELHAAPYAKNSRAYDGRPACLRCDTCYVCPTGAKYSPDFTLQALIDDGRIRLLSQIAVRRLRIDGSQRVVSAEAIETRTGRPVELEGESFVLAGGFPLAPHLLARSATTGFPTGLANSSGTLGRFIQGHPVLTANVGIRDPLLGWTHEQNRLMSRRYMRRPAGVEQARFDLSLMPVPPLPYLRSRDGAVQFGDELLSEWRSRAQSGVVQVRSAIDVSFDGESRIVDDPASRFAWGDPMPTRQYVYSEGPERQRRAGAREVRKLLDELVRRAGGEVLHVRGPEAHPHPAGGCRMGIDPATSVCDSFGRTHDHANLFVTGAPLFVSGGCTNTTLTFGALALRTASALARDVLGPDADQDGGGAPAATSAGRTSRENARRVARS